LKTVEINGNKKTFDKVQHIKVLKYCLTNNNNYRITPESIMDACDIGTENFLSKIISGINSFIRYAWNVKDNNKKAIKKETEGYYNIEIPVKR